MTDPSPSSGSQRVKELLDEFWDLLQRSGNWPYVWPAVLTALFVYGTYTVFAWQMRDATQHWWDDLHPMLERQSQGHHGAHREMYDEVLQDCHTTFHLVVDDHDVRRQVDRDSYRMACMRIAEQGLQSTARAEYHFWTYRFYLVHYYACLLTSYIVGTLAAGLLILVSRQGWDHSDPRLLSSSMMLTIAAALMNSVPALTQMDENIKANKAAFLGHDNLMLEILTFSATGESSGGIIEPVEFIHAVDSRLAKMHNIHMSFDESAVEAGAQRLLEQQPK